MHQWRNAVRARVQEGGAVRARVQEGGAVRARLQEGGAVMKKGPSDKRSGSQKSMRRQGCQMDTRKDSQEIVRRKGQPGDCEKEGRSDYEKKVLSDGLMGKQT